MDDLETAFDLRDSPFTYVLDTETGKCLTLPGDPYDSELAAEMEEDAALVESAPPGRFLSLDTGEDLRLSSDEARQFAGGVHDEGLRNRMNRAIDDRHRGWFRRFLDIVHTEAGESERWTHFERQKRREKIAGYLDSEGLRVIYEPLPAYTRIDSRRHLLEGAVAFVNRVKGIRGIERIALIGSVATLKREPNNIDLLLTIATEAIVPKIAEAGRKLKGHAQQLNRGANVFLASTTGTYLGRTCPWRECAPGIRSRCEADHCGGHLYDDLKVITLPRPLIASPPLEIWPKAVVREDVPEDVLTAFGIVR